MSHTSLGAQYFDLNLFCFGNSYQPFHHFLTICLLSDSPRFINADAVMFVYFFAASVRWAFPDTGILLPSGVFGTLPTLVSFITHSHLASCYISVCGVLPPSPPAAQWQGPGAIVYKSTFYLFRFLHLIIGENFFFSEAQTEFFWSLGKRLEWGNHIDTSFRTLNTVFFLPQICKVHVVSQTVLVPSDHIEDRDVVSISGWWEKWTVEDYVKWLLSFCINVFILQTENRASTLNNRLLLHSFISQLLRFNQPCYCRKTCS